MSAQGNGGGAFEDKTPAEPPQVAEPPLGPPRGVRTMAIVRWVLVLVTAVVATGSILSYAGVHIGGAKSAASGQIYYCPMHPSVVQDHPGECPICSMTLVPKPEGKAKPSGAMKPTMVAPATAKAEATGGKYSPPLGGSSPTGRGGTGRRRPGLGARRHRPHA